MGNVYYLVSLAPCEHFDFSCAHSSNKLGNHSLTCAKGDSVDHIAQVGFESGGDVDSSQLPLEASDFEAAGDELVAELLLLGTTGIKLLAGGEGSAVYGGNKAVGDGVDGFVNVRVCA